MRTIITWSLAQLFFSIAVLAQHEQYIDSINTVSRDAESDSVRASLFYDAAKYAIEETGDLILLRTFVDSSMHYSIKSGHASLEAKSHFAYGRLERLEGNYEKALDHLAINIRYFKDQPRAKAIAMFQVGVTYRLLGNYQKSLETYLEIEKYFESNNDLNPLAGTLNSIAILYQEMDKTPESISTYQRALEIYMKLESKRNIANTSNNIAQGYFILEDYDEARKYAEDALNIATEIEYDNLIGFSLLVLGNINDATGGNAISYYENARSKYEGSGYYDMIAEVDEKLAVQYFKSQEYGKAKQLLLSGLDLAYEKKEVPRIMENARDLSTIYAAEQDFAKAYQYHVMFKEAKDSLYNIENTRSINELLEKYNSEKKDKELSNRQLEIVQRTVQRNLAYGGTFCIMSLASFLFYRNRKNQSLSSAKIFNLENQQKLLALDYMVQGQEEERKRIAQDLHDGLGGLLSTVRIKVKAINEQVDALSNINIVDETEKLVSEACDEVRRISHDMMPASLVSLDLNDAVKDLVTDINEDHACNITLAYKGTEIPIAERQKVQIYRILQEIVQNTIKHSEANELNIKIDVNENIIMHTSDDGRGFDSVKAIDKGGIGLKNIKSRVKYLGGTIKIITSPGQGTSFVIAIPNS